MKKIKRKLKKLLKKAIYKTFVALSYIGLCIAIIYGFFLANYIGWLLF